MIVRTETSKQWYIKPGRIKYMPVLRPIEISFTSANELPTIVNVEVAEYQEFKIVYRKNFIDHLFDNKGGKYLYSKIISVDRDENGYFLESGIFYHNFNFTNLKTYDNKYKEEG